VAGWGTAKSAKRTGLWRAGGGEWCEAGKRGEARGEGGNLGVNAKKRQKNRIGVTFGFVIAFYRRSAIISRGIGYCRT
jgi:hypothetical protein